MWVELAHRYISAWICLRERVWWSLINYLYRILYTRFLFLCQCFKKLYFFISSFLQIFLSNLFFSPSLKYCPNHVSHMSSFLQKSDTAASLEKKTEIFFRLQAAHWVPIDDNGEGHFRQPTYLWMSIPLSYEKYKYNTYITNTVASWYMGSEP